MRSRHSRTRQHRAEAAGRANALPVGFGARCQAPDRTDSFISRSMRTSESSSSASSCSLSAAGCERRAASRRHINSRNSGSHGRATDSMTASISECPVSSSIDESSSRLKSAASIRSPVTQLLTVNSEMGMPFWSNPIVSRCRVVELTDGLPHSWVKARSEQRYKRIFGNTMKARALARQKTEAWISASALNRMTSSGMPVSVKI